MKQYFGDYMDNDSRTWLGRWYLESINLSNADLGITNNPAESLNNKYAQLQRDESAKPLAKLIVELHTMDSDMAWEIKKAFHSRGNYDVKEVYKKYTLKSTDMPKISGQTCKDCHWRTCRKGQSQGSRRAGLGESKNGYIWIQYIKITWRITLNIKTGHLHVCQEILGKKEENNQNQSC